ncbi:MAG: dienelactone hydrolase family protein [Chloroflexi bacterium]|uniref:Dienelactone hydrolase family protein n=1 Tax=Candidatus Chlorohelix allophototropha TaxID=3003348 RepID=A0A8T7LYB1_9CHLR|nr:dienelactone hydrolase family protein [Chloroflexota bacterium]WJW66214.1 dienelactone hydrolase family protein [Chloroflexota bacterium L227-S17]
MCYDDKAQPPIPPGAGGSAQGEELILEAADGNKFLAFAAHPAKPGKAAVLIYPDVRGLHNFYKELALRFGEIGITALAIDYFGRTAGLTSRDESFEFMPHVQQLLIDNFFQDVAAGLSYLRQQGEAGSAIFVVGFCMGGSLTLVSGTNKEFGFAGLIPFYAGLTRNFGGRGTALDLADRVSYPVLGLFGGNDPGIPVNDVNALETKLRATGIETNIKIYEGATHSFFDRRYEEFADASADAWNQILSFISSH